jgi:hypothetical protein
LRLSLVSLPIISEAGSWQSYTLDNWLLTIKNNNQESDDD